MKGRSSPSARSGACSLAPCLRKVAAALQLLALTCAGVATAGGPEPALAPQPKPTRVPRPANATNITVYHVNQANWSVTPTNMNTADARGDVYFALTTRYLPVECSGKNISKEDAFDCQNQEASSNDLAITKLVLEVDASFGAYTFCNVIDGAYICDCKWGKSGPVPCKPGVHPYSVGVKVIGPARPPKGTNTSHPTPHSRSTFWRDNARLKMTSAVRGNWYSTTEAGLCGVGPHCTWRLAAPVKKVWKNCSDAIIGGVVEKKDPGCFSRCPVLPHSNWNASVPGALNRSTVCYTDCFFGVVLGPGADREMLPLEGHGLSATELIELWDRPFAPDSPCHDLLPPH